MKSEDPLWDNAAEMLERVLQESARNPGFCPECFREQIAARKTLHLKAAWAVALATRCVAHQLPLYRCCPWCGEDQPAHFQANANVQCLSCEHALTIRRWTRNPVCGRIYFEGIDGEDSSGLPG
jgi:hypothetical protein